MDNLLFKSLEKGVKFLKSKQEDSGEFKTKEWVVFNNEAVFGEKDTEKSVFITSFILHSLKFIKEFIHDDKIAIDVKKIAKKARIFLRNEKRESGLWRFAPEISFDIDCTCCVSAVLKEWGEKEIDYELIAQKLLNNRGSNNFLKTWIFDDDTLDLTNQNDVDWVVNVNVLFFYSLINKSLPTVEDKILQIVQKGIFKKQSTYYPSLSGIYCLTRTYADAHNEKLQPAIEIIKKYLLKNRFDLLKDDLSLILILLSLLNCDTSTDSTDHLFKHLLMNQKFNGGWSKGAFFHAFPPNEIQIGKKWGSEALTTAFALEAISKRLHTN